MGAGNWPPAEVGCGAAEERQQLPDHDHAMSALGKGP